MSKKIFQISAAGMNNIVFGSNNVDDEFVFHFGQEEVRMNRLFADFISPRVSRIHQTDITINSLELDFINSNHYIQNFINKPLLDAFELISKGSAVSIDEEIGHKLLILCIFLDNSELYKQINEIFPIVTDKTKIEDIYTYMKIFNCYQEEEKSSITININEITDYISQHFDEIDKKILLTLSKPTLYSILMNKQLKISSEDYLFDFINELFSNETSEENKEKNYFYETLELSNLSEMKFNELIEQLEPCEISTVLWSKLKEFMSIKCITKNKNNFLFDQNSKNRFNGIIFHLAKGNPRKLIDEGIIDVIGSSNFEDNLYDDDQAENVIDYENDDKYFYSKNIQYSWIMVDFKKRKIKPTHYSIKENQFGGKGHWHLQSWVIEGSNDCESWRILDTRRNENSLDFCSASNTFNITRSMGDDEFYRFVRLRQIGINTQGNHSILISALEFFGFVKNTGRDKQNASARQAKCNWSIF